MASCPDYEPAIFYNGITTEKLNEYNSLNVWRNKAIQNPYAPGSIFKMVTAIAGLETGVTDTRERINDIGVYPAAHEPECWYYGSYGRGHGPLNITQAIEKSCNFFFYEIGNRMGIDTLSKYASYFGLGRKTGVELTGEVSGVLARKSITEDKGTPWVVGNTLVAAIGQGYNDFTPVQMAKYLSMVANGGNNVEMSIIKSVVNSDGTEVSDEELNEFLDKKLNRQKKEEVQVEPISQETINAVLAGMKSVTETGTASSIFQNFDIEVGGKTGSAETSSQENADVNAWFAGFAPFDNPEIAIIVLVENGGHGYYTAEVAREIITEYFGINAKAIHEDMTASSEIEKIR